MENQIISDEIITNYIYYVRGQKVMLDKDLAELYQVTTGNLNKAVARNIKRFPEDFMFRLTDDEFKTCSSKMEEQVGEGRVWLLMPSQNRA